MVRTTSRGDAMVPLAEHNARHRVAAQSIKFVKWMDN